MDNSDKTDHSIFTQPVNHSNINHSNINHSHVNTTTNDSSNETNKSNLISSDINNVNNVNKNDYSSIEFTLEDIFVNLTLISRIEVGNKLIRYDKYINIDTSYFQFLTRWFTNQNRSDGIKFTVFVLSNAFDYSDHLSKQKDDESRHNLLRLNTSLSNAMNGLSNLSQTYHYDKLTQSEIEVMINNIRTKLNIQSKHIQFVQDNRHNNENRENKEHKETKEDKEKKNNHSDNTYHSNYSNYSNHSNHKSKYDTNDLKHSIIDTKHRDKKDERNDYRDNKDYNVNRDINRVSTKDNKDNKDNTKDHDDLLQISHLKKKGF